MTPNSEMSAAALVILAEANIPPDIQELLVRGDPMRGIAPNALGKALTAARQQGIEDAAKVAENYDKTLAVDVSSQEYRYQMNIAAAIRSLSHNKD